MHHFNVEARVEPPLKKRHGREKREIAPKMGEKLSFSFKRSELKCKIEFEGKERNKRLWFRGGDCFP
jgi:hypothetical protein